MAAMVLSIVGIALGLSVSGVVAYALPALGEAYLGGQEETALTVVASIIAGTWGTISRLFVLLYSAGFILFGFAVWGSGTLPRWAGVLLAIHAPLLSAPLPDVFSVLGHCCCSPAAGGLPRASCGGPLPGRKLARGRRKERR